MNYFRVLELSFMGFVKTFFKIQYNITCKDLKYTADYLLALI